MKTITSKPIAQPISSNSSKKLFSSTLSKALGFVNKIDGRTCLVDDNSNLFQGGRDREFRIDHGACVKFLGGDQLLSASIVVSQPPTASHHTQQFFYDALQRQGWFVYRHLTLKTSDGKFSENEQLVDGDVRRLIRDAADSLECDSIVLMSGDGGMTNTVKYARRAGKNVFVVAWNGTLHPALAAAATDCATIEELRPLVARVLH